MSEDSIDFKPAEPSAIVFHVNYGVTEMLKLCPNGDIFVRGKLAANDLEVVDGFRRFLSEAKFTPKEEKLKMSDKVEVEFKFKVGDLVMPAAVSHLMEDLDKMSDMWLNTDSNVRYIVSERLYQQCYGGVQIHYTCKCILRNGGVGREDVRFTEPQLVAASMFKTKKEVAELRKKDDEKDKEERDRSRM